MIWDTLGWILIALVGAGLLGGAILSLRAERGRDMAEAAIPPDGRRVPVELGSVTSVVHLTEAGAKRGVRPTIALIHGNGGSLRHFARVADDLSADHHVVSLDRPGAGYSRRPAQGASSLSEQAALLRAALAEIEVGRAVLVGHSFGASVALAWALDAPESVAGLALLAPGAYPFAPKAPFDAKPVTSGPMRALLSWTLAPRAVAKAGPGLVKAMFAPDPVPEDYATTYGGLLGLRPWQIAAVMEDAALLQDALAAQAPRYEKVATPTAIAIGAEDALLVPEEQGAPLAAAVPGATLEIVSGAGHMLPVARPEETARIIRDLIARIR